MTQHQGSKDEPSVAELNAKLEAVQTQREYDLSRYARVVKEAEWLRYEVALRNAEGSPDRRGIDSSEINTPSLKLWDVMPAIARSLDRGETRQDAFPLAWLWAALFLRFARVAARRRDYATAEVFYQAVLHYRPRPFIWRQLGNMLAGQGLFYSAIQCFNQAINLNPHDAETWRVKSLAHKRVGEAEQSQEAHVKASHIAALQGDHRTE
jgi:tetratricopeptide (TPR) repeat protein